MTWVEVAVPRLIFNTDWTSQEWADYFLDWRDDALMAAEHCVEYGEASPAWKADAEFLDDLFPSEEPKGPAWEPLGITEDGDVIYALWGEEEIEEEIVVPRGMDLEEYLEGWGEDD